MTTEKYDEQITITSKAITVGGVEIPGCICATGITVTQDPEITDHWTVNFELMTGTPPVFAPDVTVDESGIVRPGGEPA